MCVYACVCVSDCVCMCVCVVSVMCGALTYSEDEYDNITRQNPCTQFIPLILRVMSIASLHGISMYTNESGLMSTVGY